MKIDTTGLKMAIGVYDDPEQQYQGVFYVEPFKYHIGVFGQPFLGKTTFLKQYLIYSDKHPRKFQEEIYILDFGRGLKAYGDLKNVCAYVDSSNEENIKRVFQVLEARLKENSSQLDAENYLNKVEKSMGTDKESHCPPHQVLMIDNINSFLTDERYATYQERLVKLCRDGLSNGLTVVFTANDTTGVKRILPYIGQKLAFSVATETSFDVFGQKVLEVIKYAGRGVANRGSNVYEVQGFLPFRDSSEEEAYLKAHSSENSRRLPKSFPAILTEENYQEYREKGITLETDCQNKELVVGLDYYNHQPVKLRYLDSENHAIAIYGKKQFGKSNLLSVIIEQFQKQQPNAKLVLLDDGRKQLEHFKRRNDEYFDTLEAFRQSRYLEGTTSGSANRTQQPAQTPKQTPVGRAEFSSLLSGLMAEQTSRGTSTAQTKPQPTPTEGATEYTLFVIQNRGIYRSAGKAFIKHLIGLMNQVEEKKYLFIFSDVKKISDIEQRIAFSDCLTSAFVLDSIGDFLTKQGDKNVFEGMEAAELKAEYAPCEVGDGYYYDVERDKLTKLKLLKAKDKEKDK